MNGGDYAGKGVSGGELLVGDSLATFALGGIVDFLVVKVYEVNGVFDVVAVFFLLSEEDHLIVGFKEQFLGVELGLLDVVDRVRSWV